jgi:predicted MPP superfamily phosphohydrolase
MFLATVLSLFMIKDLLAWSLYRRRVPDLLGLPAGSPRRWWAVAAVTAVFAAMNLPNALLLLTFGRFGFPPSDGPLSLFTDLWYLWHFGGALMLAVYGVGRLLSGLFGLFAGGRVAADSEARREPRPPEETEKTPVPETAPVEPLPPTRREWLEAVALAAPPLLIAGGTAAAVSQRGRVEVNRLRVSLPGLPDALRGMTITHISDLHIGRTSAELLLPSVAAAVRELRSDLIVLTGDIVDRSNSALPPVIDTLRTLEAPLGLFVSVGNHDEFDDRGEFIRTLRDADILRQGPRTVLYNGTVRLSREGADFSLGGIGWTRTEPEHREAVAEAFGGSPTALPRLLLAHHPHAFDAAAEAGVALTLSGHTHGGQIALLPGGPSLGDLAFRYVAGLYRRPDGRAVFVSRGAGNWFPLRVNCPAEVVQVELA